MNSPNAILEKGKEEGSGKEKGKWGMGRLKNQVIVLLITTHPPHSQQLGNTAM